ncbi:MAG TPA: glycosyltransferase 87 family protein [Gaiellaceae bacterium]
MTAAAQQIRRFAPANLAGLGVLIAAIVFLWSWELVGHSSYAHRGSSDVGFYQVFASEIADGKVPYRDFAVEYPPGALVAFAAPITVVHPSRAHSYDVWFARAMGALGLLCMLLGTFVRRAALPLFVVAVSPLAVGSLALTRFDLWPATLTLAAIAALVNDRHRLGWAALAAAFAAKLYPIVLVPLAIAWTVRRRGGAELRASAAVGAAVAAAAFVPFAIVAPRGLWDSLWGQVSRPLEIESLAASYVKAFGHPHIVGTHGALAVSGHGVLAALSTVTEIVVLVALWTAFARGNPERDRLVRFAAASICTFIAFGKVLSPQYLIWLVPLVPLVRGARGLAASALLAVAIGCTDVVWYGAHRFDDYAFSSDWAWLVLTRNLILVAIVGVLAVPARFRSRAPSELD